MKFHILGRWEMRSNPWNRMREIIFEMRFHAVLTHGCGKGADPKDFHQNILKIITLFPSGNVREAIPKP
jgi:hypothetical protein